MSIDVLPSPSSSSSSSFYSNNKASTSKQITTTIQLFSNILFTQLESSFTSSTSNSSLYSSNNSLESSSIPTTTTTTINSSSLIKQQRLSSSSINNLNNNTQRFHYNSTSDFRFSSSSSEQQQQQPQINKMALTVLARVHRWCCQLFWLTIVCFMGICGEQQRKKENFGNNKFNGINNRNGIFGLDELRKSLKLQASQRHGSKKLEELEAQLLRHLTRPQDDMFHHRNNQSQYSIKPKIYLSCPPSPRLFKISEEESES